MNESANAESGMKNANESAEIVRKKGEERRGEERNFHRPTPTIWPHRRSIRIREKRGEVVFRQRSWPKGTTTSEKRAKKV